MDNGIPYTRSLTSLRMELRETCDSFDISLRHAVRRTTRWVAEAGCRKHGVMFWVYDGSREDVLRHAYRVMVREHRKSK